MIQGTAKTKTQVTHVLSRLRLRDDVQGVIFAYESRLIEPGDDDAATRTDDHR